MRSIIWITLIIATALSTVAQNRREDQPLPEELYELYRQKSEDIGQAIKKSKNEWAGTYLAGDHHPTVFALEPEAGFIVSSSHHTFAPSWINYGRIAITGSTLRIYPELGKTNPSAHTMRSEFRLVRWGRQHFLLNEEEFQPFAYAVHARDEFWIGQHFLRAEDRDEPRGGFPDLPSDLQTIMRMRSMTTRVTSVGPEIGFGQRVTIGAGTDQKVGKGMFFYYSTKGYQYSVRITEVSARSSNGETWSLATTGEGADGDVPIKIGQKLSSRVPKDFVQPG